MPKTKPKKHFQVQRMFGLAKEPARSAGMELKEYLEFLAPRRLSELSFDEANAVIVALGGEPFRSYGNSKRNENHKKQVAGIKTVETEAHLTAIREAAALRNMNESGIESLANRMNLPWPPLTTDQGNKVFEAIKAMNKRDNIVAFPAKKTEAPAAASSQPAFRRVA